MALSLGDSNPCFSRERAIHSCLDSSYEVHSQSLNSLILLTITCLLLYVNVQSRLLPSPGHCRDTHRDYGDRWHDTLGPRTSRRGLLD